MRPEPHPGALFLCRDRRGETAGEYSGKTALLERYFCRKGGKRLFTANTLNDIINECYYNDGQKNQ